MSNYNAMNLHFEKINDLVVMQDSLLMAIYYATEVNTIFI